MDGHASIERSHLETHLVADELVIRLRVSRNPSIRKIASAVAVCQYCLRSCPGPDACTDFVAFIDTAKPS
jgi:hypothetical protein